MVQQGKAKIMQLRNLSKLKADEISSLFKPVDERTEFLKAQALKRPRTNAQSAKKPIKPQKQSTSLRMKRYERTLQQMRKPERDFIFQGENTIEYDMRMNSQVEELQAILSQQDINLPTKKIDLALRHPKFEWSQTISGVPKYNDPGVHLPINKNPRKKMPRRRMSIKR